MSMTPMGANNAPFLVLRGTVPHPCVTGESCPIIGVISRKCAPSLVIWPSCWCH
ncbi:unnamed protein product [Staurois parvus]|uniref:Uncharacterized protein n=1 Tax=Staurois parvus TaxID=386267 RepID=A0ABN9DM82_9NEOB|nr:unnamed protein product [Staurois parvus]